MGCARACADDEERPRTIGARSARTMRRHFAGTPDVSSTRTAQHARAITFMVTAGILWSSGGFLVRQLSIVDAWEIVFWRSLFMTLFVAGVLGVLHGRHTVRAIRDVGAPG